MKIYIAGSYNKRDFLKAIGEVIANLTLHEITSRWFFEQAHANPIRCALMDLQDIDAADCVLLFMDGESTKGGRMVELGYAMAKNKPVIIIGQRTNVFTHLIPCFEKWEDALLP